MSAGIVMGTLTEKEREREREGAPSGESRAAVRWSPEGDGQSSVISMWGGINH